MTIEEAIKLIDSGFTRDDILKLSEDKSEEKGASEQTQEHGEKASKPSGANEKAPEAPKSPETGSDAETVKSLTEQVKSLTEAVRALQGEAAKKAESTPPEKVTADNIIKSFFGNGKGA